MPTFNVPIGSDGVLLDVLVGLSAPDVQALRNAGRPVPAPLLARALVDTGANVSCIDPRLAAPLTAAGIMPSRLVLANVPALGGVGTAAEYVVTWQVVHPSGNARSNFVLRDHPVVEQALGHLGYEALLGRDGLDQLLHIYN